MNKVLSVLNLFGLITHDNGQETAVETYPLLPQEWREAGGDLIPLPGQKVQKVIQRMKVDGNVRIYEQEVIYITEPEPTPEEPYPFVTHYGETDLTPAEQAQIVADWHRGKAVWIAGPPDPDRALFNQRSTRGRPVKIVNGRIVLQE